MNIFLLKKNKKENLRDGVKKNLFMSKRIGFLILLFVGLNVILTRIVMQIGFSMILICKE